MKRWRIYNTRLDRVYEGETAGEAGARWVLEHPEEAGLTVHVREVASYADLPPRGQAMLWLAGESEAYAQRSKYAESTDNREMIAQLVRTNDGDLWGFPLSYLKRAQLMGLDTPQGRQALGKAAATIIDYMTHAVEIHGPMPKPGVPSGEIEEWT